MTYMAVRKPTLHGILGTGNRIGSVIQYPVASRDPYNLCQGRRNHLSAEDRRILRVRVKYHMRRLRGSQDFADGVFMVENALLKGFANSPEMCQAFFQNEAYADKMLEQTAYKIDANLAGIHPPPPKKVPGTEGEHSTIPGHHDTACSPQCYCLKFQDTPLSLKGDPTQGDPSLWMETFADITKRASKGLINTVQANHGDSMRLKLSQSLNQ